MERIGDDVRRTLERFGPQAGMPELLAAWPVAVGEAIARNAWPTRFSRDGTLNVAVASSAWAFELAQLAPTIQEQLAEALGKAAPKALKFLPGPLPEAITDPGGEAPRTPVRAGPEHEAAAAELVTPIADENLRKIVAKTAALSLARGADDRPI